MQTEKLLEPRLVAGLPYLGERDGRMEAMEDAQGQGDPLYDGPRQEPVELELHRVRLDLLRLERVDDPHRHVAYEQEGDDLPPGLRTVMLRQMDATARYVRYEQQLKDDLEE